MYILKELVKEKNVINGVGFVDIYAYLKNNNVVNPFSDYVELIPDESFKHSTDKQGYYKIGCTNHYQVERQDDGTSKLKLNLDKKYGSSKFEGVILFINKYIHSFITNVREVYDLTNLNEIVILREGDFIQMSDLRISVENGQLNCLHFINSKVV